MATRARLTADVDPEVKKRVKIAAVESDSSVSEWVERAVVRELERAGGTAPLDEGRPTAPDNARSHAIRNVRYRALLDSIIADRQGLYLPPPGSKPKGSENPPKLTDGSKISDAVIEDRRLPMWLYPDTSAPAKLYIDEDDREFVVTALGNATRSVASTIAYTETRSALARKHREGVVGHERYRRAVADLDHDWVEFGHRDVTQSLAVFAGELTEHKALKGYDAVHLATALAFALEFDDLEFLSFDNRRNEAARSASLRIHGEPANGSNSNEID